MKKLAALTAALVFALAFAPPALSQEDGGTQYCGQVLQQVGEDQYPEGGFEHVYPCAEECEYGDQCEFSLTEVAEMAADAAVEASVAATRDTDGAVDGAAAYAAALDAARKTGVDEGTAETVATRAVASIAPEEAAEPAQLTVSSTEPSAPATEEPEPIVVPSREREPVAGSSGEQKPVVESAQKPEVDEKENAGEEPAGGASRNEDAAQDSGSVRSESRDNKKVDGKLNVTVLPITDGDPPAGDGAFGIPFAPLAAVAPALLAFLVAAGLFVRRFVR